MNEELNKITGHVLRIERSSLHDGEGLRTVVFLKGCPLRCLWCSTPESQLAGKELGFRDNRCTGCGTCITACNNGALRMENGLPIRNVEQCKLCFACEKACPNDVWEIYGTEMTSQELVREIAKDEIFYFHSGGGVTFSGGEPLEQVEFVAEVMSKCREHGIHTAVETGLYTNMEQIEAVLSHLNLLFVDLKVMDHELHRKVTGVDNRLILNNLRAIDSGSFSGSVCIRIPIIPGINDGEENLKATVRFCDSLKKVEEIELLPYHRLGAVTYRKLGREYQLSQTVPPTAERMQELKALMLKTAARVKVRIGS